MNKDIEVIWVQKFKLKMISKKVNLIRVLYMYNIYMKIIPAYYLILAILHIKYINLFQ